MSTPPAKRRKVADACSVLQLFLTEGSKPRVLPTVELCDRVLVTAHPPPLVRGVPLIDPCEFLSMLLVYIGGPSPPLYVNAALLRSLAAGIYNAKEISLLGVDPTRNNTHAALYLRNPGGMVRTNDIDYLPPSSDGLYEAHSMLAMKYKLRSYLPSGMTQDAPIFIERYTADELALYQYTLDQTVVHPKTGEHIRRPPCFTGRPRDGRIGCAVYQIDRGRSSRIEGALGVYLHKLEAIRYLEEGELPLHCETRCCVLCELNTYHCEVGLNNIQGIGQPAPALRALAIIQKFQVPVNVVEGYAERHCMTTTPTLAPILAFRPYLLSLITNGKGKRQVCDDRLRYQPFPANGPAFR